MNKYFFNEGIEQFSSEFCRSGIFSNQVDPLFSTVVQLSLRVQFGLGVKYLLSQLLLFCLVFGGMYALLTGVLHDHLPLGGGMAENWIHCGLIAVVGTAVCCILFLLPDKRIVPYSFASLPVITIMCVVAAFQLEPAARNMMLYVTFLYTLMPILVGNAVSWTVYFKLCKNPMPRRL